MQQSSRSLLIKVTLALITGVCLITANNSYAQPSAGATHAKSTAIPTRSPDGTWESLSLSQQKILAPLESDWDYMLPDSRKKWVQLANLYPKMNTLDQERLQSRMASWSNLSQKDRRIARENYLTSLKFPAEKKAEAWSAYQKLSDEEKKKLAEMEAKKKPNAISAPTLQQHPIQQDTTPPPPATRPRAAVPEPAAQPATPSAEQQ